MDAHPTVDVEVVPKPFYEVVQSYKVAAIGGEAPDLMRISNDQLGSIAPVRVDGYQLLEDLRPWLSPVQRQMWDPIALQSMRYENDLLALLPIVDETGQRMSPMVGYKGWAVSE